MKRLFIFCLSEMTIAFTGCMGPDESNDSEPRWVVDEGKGGPGGGKHGGLFAAGDG